ncbi:uncharacterized protein CIMG_06785 [Coccidioides immitis RS]|uniref:Tyrosine specific protein phosphatases domain-containing protein n=4 Tax=Coccidioides immitis TaxID=5501 RepID=J3K8X1_COCIM|nr:uncharacterized protein CIMG_06785 [Coccidioides immitis RS]KMP03941.1 tyrosine/serine phosphatase [Coccidioides immitis RMSCC 2394]KMU74917.1 aldo/keto reductase family protein [Coccidioides immitis RMSCC 3703]KMU86098.1 tyrosine/serine phosphatase [Coccidioides immitis H538.4]TPX24130.1 hypothetical protein DIZ76_013473 [Coccidioides immitis]EAS31306.3 hypothetical protein CIMG_06785 [Coccidioides immitis RS]
MQEFLQTSLPSPPFYIADGISNLRDVGGYAISSTASVRRNFIYRSAHLSRATPEGAKVLAQQLGISKIFDFRSVPETLKNPSCEIPGAERLHVPVFTDQDASPESLALRYKHYASEEGPKAFMHAYKEILQSGASNAFKTVFEHIRDQPNQPLLFHCTGGKDRTGVFAALVLRVAGVRDDDVIGQEYELTEVGLGSLREEFIQNLLKHPALQDDPSGAHRMTSAKAEAIKATLAWLDATYGSVEGYMKKAIGFGDDDIAKIRKNLLVEEKAIL